MPILVEARRPDRDRFFGRTVGWHVERDGATYEPGDEFNFVSGVLVFNDDGYRTSFSCIKPSNGPSRVWIRCSDAKTQLHLSLDEKTTSIQLLSAEPDKVLQTDQRKKLLSAHLSSSFRQEPSPYRKAVLRVSIGSVVFSTSTWEPSYEENDILELTISFKDCTKEKLYAKGRSELISDSKEFTTYSNDLGVSLLKINDNLSRAIHVDPGGNGFREGIREGDLLLTSSANNEPRRWRRMQVRRVVFDNECEFDIENEEDEAEDGDDGGATSKQFLTFSLRLIASSESAASDVSLEPLEYLFGADPILETNGVGNCQLGFDLDAIHREIRNITEVGGNYLHIQNPNLELTYEKVLPSEVLAFRFTLNASMSLSLIATDEQGVHSDVALVSLRKISVRNLFTADGGQELDAQIHSFQVDDQQGDAAFPVTIFPTPLGPDIDPDAPSFRLFVSLRSPDPALVSIRNLEFFLTETTLKLHESFLMGLLEFASSLTGKHKRDTSQLALPEDTAKAAVEHLPDPQAPANVFLERSDDEGGEEEKREREVPKVREESNSSPSAAAAAAAPTNDLGPSRRRVYIDEADFKPMRFNLTFTSSTIPSEKRLRVQLRQIPFVAALVTAVAAVSDAPLRLSAVRFHKESKTAEAMVRNIIQHYSGEALQGVLALAGSTDLLGSPVHLFGSVSQGAFSFFYEPALALSMGYGQLGRGIQKGGSALIQRSAGALFDSVCKMTRAVAKALATTSADQQFVLALSHQLKVGVYSEPINGREGIANGFLVLVRSILDAVVGFYPRSKRGQTSVANKKKKKSSNPFSVLVKPMLALLLKPAAGFFAALNQVSTGIRNVITTDRFQNYFPLRLPRPRESKLLPYSANRSAGYLLARNRFGKDVQFVLSDICQLEMQLDDHTKFATVTTVVTTDSWIVACRETLLDVWALPLEMLTHIHIDERRLLFTCLGTRYVIRCKSKADTVALHRALDFASKLRQGQVRAFESFLDAIPKKHKPGLRASALWDLRSTRRNSLRQIEMGETSVVVGGNELDIAGCQVGSASIQSYGQWPDGVYRYLIKLVSVDLSVEWTIERRYSEFLKFRDHACKFLNVSRRSIPLPGRRPWALTPAEHEERWVGLQHLLDLVLRIDLLAESEVLREFLTRGADNVVIRNQ